jgi:hypothetical protein
MDEVRPWRDMSVMSWCGWCGWVAGRCCGPGGLVGGRAPETAAGTQ